MESNFDKAQKLAMRWPKDKTIPAKLVKLYKAENGDPMVGLFFEALYAAANGPEDLELIGRARLEEDEE
ncbi:hypothetical protein SynSYN20_01611 [Synechococcus sp. SYN20]|jgi:hypothetical protein|uniref:hypothetical protein n=1 Tax=Synechococcus sp. SYN20 TaxID=1050714 RepID=UPI001647D4A5|nr:hypothetical protein [Synechococcus sp. SYN20]QNJ25938.1 hypothetical protein SynSYN20_01611 [Synechococcus sp. SYN20]